MSTTEVKSSGSVVRQRSWKKRKWYEAVGGRMGPVDLPDDNYQDLLARAIQRERDARRVRRPERDSVWAHVFRCVCCGRVRGEQERREPHSEVCIRCVRDAGFWN